MVRHKRSDSTALSASSASSRSSNSSISSVAPVPLKKSSKKATSLLGDPHKTSELNIIIKKMDVVISATHSDDTARLKSQISHYTAFNTKDHPIRPAIYDGSGLHSDKAQGSPNAKK
ncbi:hypothetical protein DFH29DRAFT_1004705 [Suillus ampliporus]|nr:hypothetical protein DFH29DRAFT_1004705 [Suillus ampliporus]